MSDDTDHTLATAAGAADAAPAPQPGAASALPEAEIARLTDDIIAALKTVYDPEIPADIYELGLIYKIDIADDRAVALDMTLTTPTPGTLATAFSTIVGNSPAAGQFGVVSVIMTSMVRSSLMSTL